MIKIISININKKPLLFIAVYVLSPHEVNIREHHLHLHLQTCVIGDHSVPSACLSRTLQLISRAYL